VAHSPLRLPRHVAPVRQRAGGGVPACTLESLNQIVLTSATARRVGDRRRTTGGHLDGIDPDEGLVMGTRSVNRPSVITTVADGGDERGGHRVHAQPPVRRDGSRRRDRLPVLHQRIESGDAEARLAYDVYITGCAKYIGAYSRCSATPTSSRSPQASARTTRWCGATRSVHGHARHRNSTSTQRQPGKGPASHHPDMSPTTVLVIPPTRSWPSQGRALRAGLVLVRRPGHGRRAHPRRSEVRTPQGHDPRHGPAAETSWSSPNRNGPRPAIR